MIAYGGHWTQPPATPPAPAAPVPDKVDPPHVDHTSEYVPWPAYTPRPWPAATGRWRREIADAHAEHLRAVAQLADHGAVLPNGVVVEGEQPWIVPTLRGAFRGLR